MASSRYGAVQAEGQLHLAGLADLAHRGVERAEQADAPVVAEADAVAGGEPLGRPREGAPAVLVHPLVQVEGDDRAGIPAQPLAAQRRPDHLRVVEHQRVARPQQRRQVAHMRSSRVACIPALAGSQRGAASAISHLRALPHAGGGALRPTRDAADAPPAGARHRAGWRAPARCGRRADRSRTGRCACGPCCQGSSASANRGRRACLQQASAPALESRAPRMAARLGRHALSSLGGAFVKC